MVPPRAPAAQLWGEAAAPGLSADQRRRQAAIHHRAFGPATGAAAPRGVHRAFSGASTGNTVRRPNTSASASAKGLPHELTFAIWPFPVRHSSL